jgi:hypothetical protein
MGIRRAAAANQARLLGNRFNVVPIANATRRWKYQGALVDPFLRPLRSPTSGVIRCRCRLDRLIS